MIERISSLIKEAECQAKASGRMWAVSIAATRRLNNPDFIVGPIREVPEVVVASFIVSQQEHVDHILRVAMDHSVPLVLVDTERKVSGLGDLLSYSLRFVSGPLVLPFGSNDATAAAANILLSLTRLSGSTRVGVVGLGSLGFKLALMCAERWIPLTLIGRSMAKLATIRDTLLYITPSYQAPEMRISTSLVDQIGQIDVLLVCTPGVAVVDSDIIDLMPTGAFILDVGIGTVTPEGITKAHKRNITVQRLDVRPGFSAAVRLALAGHDFVNEIVGSRLDDGIQVVSGGVVGTSGAVVLDSLSRPSRVIGIANGSGDLIRREYTVEEQERIRRISAYHKLT